MVLSPFLHKKSAPHQGRSAIAPRGTTRVCRRAWPAASHRDNGDESVRAYPAIILPPDSSPWAATRAGTSMPSAGSSGVNFTPRRSPPRFQPRRGSLSDGHEGLLSPSQPNRNYFNTRPRELQRFIQVFTKRPVSPGGLEWTPFHICSVSSILIWRGVVRIHFVQVLRLRLATARLRSG